MADINMNPEMKGFCPTISASSKAAYREYARSDFHLDSRNYCNGKLLPFQNNDWFSITFNDFLIEMAVRTLHKEDIPMAFPLVSRGQWKGQSGSSPIVGVASLNRTLCKVGMSNYVEFIDEFSEKMALRSIRKPYYIKGLTRMCEIMPDVF
jgi:hypothetical protein